jgi:hypothetical protein
MSTTEQMPALVCIALTSKITFLDDSSALKNPGCCEQMLSDRNNTAETLFSVNGNYLFMQMCSYRRNLRSGTRMFKKTGEFFSAGLHPTL